MNNNDVARMFAQRRSGSGSNFHTDGTTLYSYNTAIAKWKKDGTIVINDTKYSRTTSKQLGYLKRNIPSDVKVSYVDNKGYGFEFDDESNNFTQTNDDTYRKHFRNR